MTATTNFFKQTVGKILLYGALGSGILICGMTVTAQVVESGLKAKKLKAPAWELQDVNGKVVKSSDFKGKVIILDFWATWCPPCRKEIPGFIELQKKYGEKGLVVIGVSIDEGGLEGVKAFIMEQAMNYPVVMANPKILEEYGVSGPIPLTFIMDRDGYVVGGHTGFAPREVFEKEIVPLL